MVMSTMIAKKMILYWNDCGDNLGSVERGVMGSVVVLLHSTGQTQVISSSQERTRHSRATEGPHGGSPHYNGLSSMGLHRKYCTIPT